MTSLAEAADYRVEGRIEQTRRADARFQIGRGKARELAEMVEQVKADKVIFDNALTPGQAYNLAKIAGVEIIDRFQLILEIFSKRASTREAKLQIHLAKLRHQLPRAREMVRLARMEERPGFQGLGTYEVEVYCEDIKRQIHHIRQDLRRIRGQRRLHRDRRIALGFPLVSLAGYTNAGKTSLFNSLTGESKSVDVGVFTTLSTTTRAINLEGGKALITDTVGFIDRLPLALVEAFHSTLEETSLSNAIILLLDFHESVNEIKRKLACSLDTLNEIGAGGIPIVTALNKIDLLSPDEVAERLSHVLDQAPNPLLISARTGRNLDELGRRIARFLGDVLTLVFSLPPTKASISFISTLHRRVHSIETVYNRNEVRITLRAFRRLIEEIAGEVEKRQGTLLMAQPPIM